MCGHPLVACVLARVTRAVVRAEGHVLAVPAELVHRAARRAEKTHAVLNDVPWCDRRRKKDGQGGVEVRPDVVDRVVLRAAKVEQVREATDDAVDAATYGNHERGRAYHCPPRCPL